MPTTTRTACTTVALDMHKAWRHAAHAPGLTGCCDPHGRWARRRVVADRPRGMLLQIGAITVVS